MRPARRFGERGQAAGIEALPFGVLVFVGGLLMVVNAWTIVDRRGAVDAAAGAYLRSYTAAATAPEGRLRGVGAARATLGDQTTTAAALRFVHPNGVFGPCQVAEVTVSVDAPVVRMPFIGDFGVRRVSATQRELIQPFGAARSESTTRPLAGTVCDG